MKVEDVRQAVEYCASLEKRVPVECSGGIKLENVRTYAETGVNFISVGALTTSAHAVDMSLRVAAD
jgi:nicotinate-nucleotide pyrophosphorylase (carboxylating)